MPVDDAVVCFTTGYHSTEGDGCAAVAVEEIGTAQRELLVHAYNFTQPRTITASLRHTAAASSSPPS
jgi:hypothetical protein